MRLITTTVDLKEFCEHIKETLETSENFITIDTEFQRERTYYPQLCLIQVATASQIAVIDPLSSGIDLSCFWTILQDSDILKVFHAGRQDLEIFYLLTGQVPTPIFDTQIAATVCGFGESISYETLVQHYTRQGLDKSLQKADWFKRPLSPRQLEYAANDVRYLREIYVAMRDYLTKAQRLDWFEDDLQILKNPETYMVDETSIWKRIKFKNAHPEFLVKLQALARCREQLAREKDIPRGRIVEDDILIEMAACSSFNIQNPPWRIASRLKSVPKELITKLSLVMEDALLQPREQWPTLNAYKPSKTVAPQLFSFLEFFLHLRAEQLHIVPRLLATREELGLLLLEQDQANIRCLKDWRYEQFGKAALALIRGDISLKVEGKKVAVVEQLPFKLER